jgi:DNA polymerase-3 subunit delta'
MLKLSDIFGQEAAIEWIGRAWESGRMPHGLVFSGPVGVGKGTTARALAGLFLCEKPKKDEGCGKCESCVLMEAGNHPDFHLVYRQLVRLAKEEAKAKELSIDVVREHLIGPANLKSAMGRGKVFIVEEAERMSIGAQNAMLKTLEEPAGRTLIIFLTDQPGGLLSTIRSRCQVVRFGPLDEELTRTKLQERGFSAADAKDAAAVAEGSIGLAIKWAEDGVVARWRELTKKMDAAFEGKVAGDFAEWLKGASEEYAAKQIERDDLTSKDQATREGCSLYLRLIAQAARKRLGEEEGPDVLESICAVIDATERGQEYLDANVNTGLIYQQIAVTLERLLMGDAAARRR